MVRRGSISEAVQNDHQQVRMYYNKIRASLDDQSKTEYRNDLVWEIARQLVAEEMVLFPELERKLSGPEGQGLASQDRKDHAMMKMKLKEILDLPVTSPELHLRFQELMSEFTQYMKKEETIDLPELEQTLTPQDSATMAKSMERTKYLVPSKGDPNIAKILPFHTPMGLLDTPMDQLRNVYDSLPVEWVGSA
jgi:Hemerythrin HHE cation binding domain